MRTKKKWRARHEEEAVENDRNGSRWRNLSREDERSETAKLNGCDPSLSCGRSSFDREESIKESSLAGCTSSVHFFSPRKLQGWSV